MGLDIVQQFLKFVEQKVIRSYWCINDEKNLAFLTTTGASSINNINTVNPEVSTGTTKVNIASTETSTASFSNVTVYAFLTTQPQGSQLEQRRLKQLYMMIGRNGSKVEYGTTKHEGKKNVSTAIKWDILPENVEHQGVKTTEIIDWSDKAEEEIQANMALMTFSDSDSDNSKENIDDSLKQQQKTDSSSVKSPLKSMRNYVWSIPKVEKKTVIPTATKKEFVKPETPVRRSVRFSKTLMDGNVTFGGGQMEANYWQRVYKEFLSLAHLLLNKLKNWIAMPIWKDAFIFMVMHHQILLKRISKIEDKDELHDEDDATEESNDGSNLQNNGTADQQVNTARQEVNTVFAYEELNVEDQEIELGNIPQSYEAPTTPHTRIHKDHPMSNYWEVSQGAHTLFFVCFHLSEKNQNEVLKLIGDPAWVKAMQEELLYTYTRRRHIHDEVFAPSGKNRDNKNIPAYSSYMGFMVLPNKDVKSAFLMDQIAEECIFSYTKSYDVSTQDRKSTTGGCQFLGNRLISWQCKKQTVVATSTTEAEYVAAASCCGQVLWIQNQLLDYGYNFMDTVIYIDNTSTICIIENPVQHSKTKHIEIRHHFIRDCNAKKLIQMAKIDTQHNVADLLTKGFDAGRF
ncbi:hypothetical protein Tco_0855508 [Tanacetum coccineum]